MFDHKLAASCGANCGACEHLGDKCRGCGYIKGKPFWTAQFGVDVCPMYDCSVNIHSLEHCGLCSDFPCDLFLEMRDPSLSDQEAEQALEDRKNDLIYRAKVGTQKWLEGKS